MLFEVVHLCFHLCTRVRSFLITRSNTFEFRRASLSEVDVAASDFNRRKNGYVAGVGLIGKIRKEKS